MVVDGELLRPKSSPSLQSSNTLFTFCSLLNILNNGTGSEDEGDTLRTSTQQRLHKLKFLQKLSHQKPCWDHARLSSLVNKQFAERADLYRRYFIVISSIDGQTRSLRLLLPCPNKCFPTPTSGRTEIRLLCTV